MLEAELDVSLAKRKIISFIKEKAEASQTDGVVFELTGGVSSAVIAYLCIEALGTRRVAGLMMPDLRVADEKDMNDARNVADELCLHVEQVDIAPIHKAFMKNLEAKRSAEENLRTRIRMSLLYYHANTMNRLVVGVANKSEMLMGYFTKYGDGGVDILPIADLYGSDVGKLAEVLGINRRVISKKRGGKGETAYIGAGIDRETADKILELRLGQGLSVGKISTQLEVPRTAVEAVISRSESSAHKRTGPQICLLG